jgi:hypothetical protein
VKKVKTLAAILIIAALASFLGRDAQADEIEDIRKQTMTVLCTCAGMTDQLHMYVGDRDGGMPLNELHSSNDNYVNSPTVRRILDNMIDRIYDSPNETSDAITAKFSAACEKEMPSDPNKCPHSSHENHKTRSMPQAEKALEKDMD